MIEKLIVFNKGRPDILAQIAAITLLLKRTFAFIPKINIIPYPERITNPVVAQDYLC